MSEIRLILLLAAGDWRRSRKDFTLLWLLLSPVVNGLVLMAVLPRLAWILDNDVDLLAYKPVIVGFVFLWLCPLSIGLWASMLFLEEKEKGLKVMALLPISRSGFLAYRLWLPGLYSFFLILLGLVLCGPAGQSYGSLGWVSLVASLQTPLLGMMLFRFSKTRMQALQLSKLLRVIEFGVLFSFFWPPQWQNLAGLVFPPYWVLKTYLIGSQEGPGYGLHLGFSMLFLLPFLVWARREFLSVYHQACR